MTFEVKMNQLGMITNVTAYSLKNDSWEDFEYFLVEANKYNKTDEKHIKNRYLRASLLSLFSHIEAVVNDILKNLKANRAQRKSALHKKCNYISEHVKKACPDMETLKISRNYVSHPGGNKDDSIPFKNITIKKVSDFEKTMSAWLNSSCKTTKTQRFTDTESLVSNLTVKLGGKPSDVNKI